MRTFFATILILGLTHTLSAAIPDAPPASAPRAITIERILALSSQDQLLELATAEFEELAKLLEKATDEQTARQVAPAAERCLLELDLIGTRATMLPPLAAAERMRCIPLGQRFDAARRKLQDQCDRIEQSSAVSHSLRSVLAPLHAVFKMNNQARATVLGSQLQTIRSQIELYKLQHRDQLPDFKKLGWQQLTSRTDVDGKISDDGKFGPYLPADPRNPLTDSNRILLTSGNLKNDFQNKQHDFGYIVDEATGRIWALNPDGRVFNESVTASARSE